MKKIRLFVSFFCLFAILIIGTSGSVSASEIMQPKGKIYQTSLGGYSTNDLDEVSSTIVGKKEIGQVRFDADCLKTTTFKGYTAYVVNGGFSIGYNYDGAYMNASTDNWHIEENEDLKNVADIKLEKKVKSGVVVIQKSENLGSWETVAEISDFFAENKSGKDMIYTASEAELINGTYYSVTVAYTMAKRIKSEWYSFVGTLGEEYDRRYIVEKYIFYVTTDKSVVEFQHFGTNEKIYSEGRCENGFVLRKNGSKNFIRVEKPDGNFDVPYSDEAIYTLPGTYTITDTTKLGTERKYTINVVTGANYVELNSAIYESAKDKGFPTTNKVSTPSYAYTSYTKVYVTIDAESSFKQGIKDGFASYGVQGSELSIYLALKFPNDNLGNGWEIANDSWGKKENQKVNGVTTGEIKSGALIVQKKTSVDAEWENVDLGKYSDGFYTTDFATYYMDNYATKIYQPLGNEVKQGVYLRVLYAYQAHKKGTKEYKDYVEEYSFYLCYNELDAVTFNNLTVEEQIRESLAGEDDECTTNLYLKAQSLTNGALTVTGFRIRNDNPTMKYSVKKDGYSYIISGPSQYEVKSDGRYDISITSDVGDTKNVTIYVDTASDDELMQRYFGEKFIDGNRIYSEDFKEPVFEAGRVSYRINEISDNQMPIGGYIKNITTGEIIEITCDRKKKAGVINSPGKYEAVLTTENFENGIKSGDIRKFTFKFSIEKNSPGPQCNQKNLEDFNKNYLASVYPKYYGLSYPKLSGAWITLAFFDKQDAVNYAREVEGNKVEKQPDGTYRYNGSFKLRRPSKYESNWDLTEAIDLFAENMVQELCFDMSDLFTYMTISDDELEKEKNRDTWDLRKSVVLFGEGQKEKAYINAYAKENRPIINNLKYAYTSILKPSDEKGEKAFEFVRDKYGCDSDKIIIVDKNGKEYSIRYHQDVESQLVKAGCPSGVITIRESNVYGDSSEYQAIYISNEDINTTVTIKYYQGNEELSKVMRYENNDEEIITDGFTIEDISDDIDLLSHVQISKDSESWVYVNGEDVNYRWSEPGKYKISCVNRVGNKYSFTVVIQESDRATISFDGFESEKLESISTMYGTRNISLPSLNRYGYEFIGFYNEETGVSYSDMISYIEFRGECVLKTIWKAKNYKMILKDNAGAILDTIDIEFGKEYAIPKQNFGDNFEFISWTLDGKELKENTIKLDKENDIILVAKVKEISRDESQNVIKESDLDNEKKEQKEGRYIPIIVIISVLLLVGVFALVFFIKKGKMSQINGKAGDNDETEE